MYREEPLTTNPQRRLAPTKNAEALARGIEALQDIGELFYQRGWSLGTSSNYSVVLDARPLWLLITASGRDKRLLTADDFVTVSANGLPTSAAAARPSAETLLHVALVQHADAGAVLHTHSVWNTLLSDLYFAAGGLQITGYEMLKGLAGVTTHEHAAWIEIFDNSQDMVGLAAQVQARLTDPVQPLRHGFLLRGHGLYTWGRDLAEARRHVEVLEFLFEVISRRLELAARQSPPSAAADAFDSRG